MGLPLLVVLVAALAGYFWFGKTDPAKKRLAQAGKQGDYVFGQYFNADYVAAKGATLDLIRTLDEYSAESGGPGRNPYCVDAMLWHVRMAKLEERNSGGAQSEYMREACSRCEQLGWADCSEENLRRQVDRMDAIAIKQVAAR